MKIVIVTATTDPKRAISCFESWTHLAGGTPSIVIVLNGEEGRHGEMTTSPAYDRAWVLYKGGTYLGSVPAFRRGVDYALEQFPDADIIACLHDDFEIHESNWDTKVIRHFERHPKCGLLGFGGAIGLGDTDIYQKPYAPMQLARIGFRSNLVDAEVHGMRSLLPEPVACLDGFSQIGTREFWLGYRYGQPPQVGEQVENSAATGRYGQSLRPWTYLEDLGIVHHFYDGALGCLARRQGWETWYLPMQGRHYGGQTAVGDAGYQEWAKTQTPGGDHGFWEIAHQKAYEAFRDVLPLRA